jgi:hypothetical protein
MQTVRKSWKLSVLFAAVTILTVMALHVRGSKANPPEGPFSLSYIGPSMVTGPNQYLRSEFFNPAGPITVTVTPIDTNGNPLTPNATAGPFFIGSQTQNLAQNVTGEFMVVPAPTGTTESIPGVGTVATPNVTRLRFDITAPDRGDGCETKVSIYAMRADSSIADRVRSLEADPCVLSAQPNYLFALQ